MAQRHVLVVFAVPYREYAEAFTEALRQREPDWQYDTLDAVEAVSFDVSALARYGRLIALLSPDLVYATASAAARKLLVAYATLWEGGQRQIIPVVLRPTGRPDFMQFSRPVEAENLYAAQLADVFAREHLLDGLPDGGRPDMEYVWGEERVRGAGPPPPPPAYPPEPAMPADEEPYLEEEKATPPPAREPLPDVGGPPVSDEPGYGGYDGYGGYGDRGPITGAPVPTPPAPAPEQPGTYPGAYPGAQPPPRPQPAPEQPPMQAPYPDMNRVGGLPAGRARGSRQGGRVETLQFTAYHPAATPVGAAQTLLVYSHIAAQLRQVQQDAGTFTELGSAPSVAQGQSLRKVPRNIEIVVEPHVEGVTFSPARDRITWDGEWRRSLFRYTGANELAGRTQRGWIDVYAGGISPICTIEVALSFLAASPVASLSAPHGINVTSNVFDTVFISYSHRDREPMRQARESYEQLGVTAYHDDLLEAGDNYEQRLAAMIRASNVFHLLWSDAAAQSVEVRKEWMLALESRSDTRFIRPWFWQQPIAPPPPELSARKISFRYEHLRRSLLRPSTWF